MASAAMLKSLLVFLLAACAGANRAMMGLAAELQLEPTAPPDVFAGTSGLVCGGQEIHTLLTSDSSMDAVRGMDWDHVVSIAEGFLGTGAGAIEELKEKLARLDREIAEKERQEAPKDMTKEEAVELITASLSVQGAFGSLDIANATTCGADVEKCFSLEPSVPEDAFDNSEVAFKGLVQELLQGGNLRIQGAFMTGVCKELLSQGGSAHKDCEELCLSFGSSAQRESAAKAGFHVGAASQELQRKREMLADKLRTTELAVVDCQARKALLEGMRAYIAPLRQDITDQHSAMRKARHALAKAGVSTKAAGDKVAAQQSATAAAILKVANTSAATNQSKETLEGLQRQELAVKAKLEATGAQLAVALEEIANAEAAEGAVQGVKLAVSQMTLQMYLFAEVGTRDPVRALGLDDDTDIDGYFPKSPQQEGAAGEVRRSLDSLRDFCETKAMPAFRLVEAVDLSRLCSTGDMGTNAAGLDEAIADRVGRVKKDLTKVQATLHPLHHGSSRMTEKGEADAKLWEPEALRRTPSVFGGAEIFKGYLKHWSTERLFHRLYKQLGAVLEKARATRAALADELAQLEVAVKKAEASSRAAADSLRAALESSELAVNDRELAEATLAELTGKLELARNGLDELRRRLAEAQRLYEAALDRLLAAHKRGTGMA